MTQVIAYGPEDPLLVVDHTGESGNPALWFRQDGVAKAYMWWDQANRLLNLGTPVTNPIVSLLDNGAVGIGTVTPYVKLQVAGGGVATDSFFAFSRVQSVAPPWSVYISAPRDNTLGLFTSGVEQVTVGDDGKVTIGGNVEIRGAVGIGAQADPGIAGLAVATDTSPYVILAVTGSTLGGAAAAAFEARPPARALFAVGKVDIDGDVQIGGLTPTSPPGNLQVGGLLPGQPPGNVHITGSLRVDGPIDKRGGGFKIDHPLDPANKCLSHSFVESPDMKNVYDGVMALDERGEAVVELPDWFEALNRDFRYQLTAIGGPAPNLHVAEEVNGNRFRIAGGRAGMKVSWMVTGIRQDAWADANRIQVESAKADTECRINQQ